jgi:hypothetical protein
MFFYKDENFENSPTVVGTFVGRGNFCRDNGLICSGGDGSWIVELGVSRIDSTGKDVNQILTDIDNLYKDKKKIIITFKNLNDNKVEYKFYYNGQLQGGGKPGNPYIFYPPNNIIVGRDGFQSFMTTYELSYEIEAPPQPVVSPANASTGSAVSSSPSASSSVSVDAKTNSVPDQPVSTTVPDQPGSKTVTYQPIVTPTIAGSGIGKVETPKSASEEVTGTSTMFYIGIAGAVVVLLIVLFLIFGRKSESD